MGLIIKSPNIDLLPACEKDFLTNKSVLNQCASKQQWKLFSEIVKNPAVKISEYIVDVLAFHGRLDLLPHGYLGSSRSEEMEKVTDKCRRYKEFSPALAELYKLNIPRRVDISVATFKGCIETGKRFFSLLCDDRNIDVFEIAHKGRYDDRLQGGGTASSAFYIISLGKIMLILQIIKMPKYVRLYKK